MVRTSVLAVALVLAGCGLDGSGRSSSRGALSPALPSLNIAPGDVAVAGISSGGFMAVQLHVAYSATFRRGAAVFAGGPFDCAQGSVVTASLACMSAQNSIDVGALETTTDSWANSGNLDPTSNLSGAQVWMWSGTNDTTVKQSVMDALQSYYVHYGASVTYENSSNSGHAWISPDGPNACTTSASAPYLSNCSVDAEQAFLTQFWGALQPRNTGSLQGSFVGFDQNEFFDDHNAPAHSLDDTGWLYVPPACASGSACHLIVALHGCQQNYGDAQIGDAFIKKSGLDEWADTNGIVVLYPQTTTHSGNPGACWDWWGYDDANYAKKSGRQMLAIKRMVDRLTGQAVSSSSSSSSSGSSASSTSSSSSGSSGTGSSSGTTGTGSTSGSTSTSGTSAPSAPSGGGCGSAGGGSLLALLALGLLFKRRT